MTEERTSLIEEGDEITNKRGGVAVIDEIQRGAHGLLVYATFPEGAWFGEYQPYELPPGDTIRPFFGWACRASSTLGNGMRVGCLAWEKSEGKLTLGECETRWLETMAAIKAEDGVMQSRPTEIRLS